jgi:HK97 family phage portal protein
MRPFTAWWKSLTASPEVVEALQDRRTNFYVRLGGTNQNVRAAFERGLAASYGWMYAHQPAVRAVVDYIAVNVAQLGLKLYERVDDTERVRREDHPAAEAMKRPDDRTPANAFLFRFIADFLVYDNAYLLKIKPRAGAKLVMVRIPPATVTVSGGRFRPDFYRVWRIDGSFFDVEAKDILHWQGYNPEDPLLGLSKLETLREQLMGDKVLQATLTELAKTGLRGGHIERPVDAPEWTEPARQRFQESWRNQKAGREDAVLEEGMQFVKDRITPEDAELLNSRRFTREEVCKVYGMEHCPPEDDEERKQFYADVLPPLADSLTDALCVSLLEAEYGETDFYFEFDLNEKLRGEPEKRFQAITAAVGRPWMLVEEARAFENLPEIEGGDELTIPLNVALGSLPAPNVMPPQDPNKPPQDGSYRENPKALKAGFDPNQVRDPHTGEWVDAPGAGAFRPSFSQWLGVISDLPVPGQVVLHRPSDTRVRRNGAEDFQVSTGGARTPDWPRRDAEVSSAEEAVGHAIQFAVEYDRMRRRQPKALDNGQKALEVTTLPRREADMKRQQRYIDEVRGALTSYYRHQGQSLQAKGQKAANSESWNKKLTAVLLKLLKGIVDKEGGIYTARLGGVDFDMRHVDHYLKSMAKGTAEGLNKVTQQDIAEMGTALALERAMNLRAEVASANIGARVTLFSRQEAAKQSPHPELRSMEWVKHTERHADLDGKRVPLGSDWGGIEPGSEPNCACSVTIG